MSKFIKISLLVALLAIQAICTTGFLEREEKKIHHKKTFIEIVRQENACYRFNNCLTYQVTPELFNDYGCSVCEPGYQLQEDINGSGVCVRNKKPSHCVQRAINPFTHDGKDFCYQCKKGFVLSYDALKCFPTCELVKKVDNCVSYSQNENGSVVCQSCKTGFTVSEDGSKCIEGCPIENCQTCLILNEKTYCYNCDNGRIGTWDVKLQVYTTCLSCRDWQCHLLTGDAQKCCFNEKH